MKNLTLIITILLININLFSQTAQNNYSGKFYVAEISASCKKMVNGGCMIYSYCVMTFDKDSVEVSYPTKASCSPSEVEKNYNNNNSNLIKKYKWIIRSDKLDIKGFEDLNKYSFSEKNVDFVKNLYTNNVITLDKSVKKTKTIRGFVFEDYMIPAQMEVSIKGTDIKTQTDADGKFTIEANEGDVLIISAFGERTIEIIITEKNCYTCSLFRDTGLIYRTKKGHRERNKMRRKAIRKFKQGFYDCND